MNYTTVQNPKWSNAEQTAIDCKIDFDGVGLSPFTANPDDVYEYSKQIFSDCVQGKYGPVASYEPPPPYIASAAENKSEAESRLVATDWVNQPDVHDPANTPHLTNRDAFITYRSQVRAILVSPVDGNLDWPEEPAALWSGV